MRVIKLSAWQLVEARIAELEHLIREGESLRDDMRRKMLVQEQKLRDRDLKIERQTAAISTLIRRREAEREALHKAQERLEKLEKRHDEQEAFLKAVKQSARELGCWDSILEHMKNKE